MSSSKSFCSARYEYFTFLDDFGRIIGFDSTSKDFDSLGMVAFGFVASPSLPVTFFFSRLILTKVCSFIIFLAAGPCTGLTVTNLY